MTPRVSRIAAIIGDHTEKMGGGGGPTHFVTNMADLQLALDGAAPFNTQPGDTIEIANGTYNGAQLDVDNLSGIPGNPITVRAQTRHQVILVGTNQCSRAENAFTITRPHWIFQDLRVRNYGVSFHSSGNGANNKYLDLMIDGFRRGGILFLTDGGNNMVNRCVIMFGTACAGLEDSGIEMDRSNTNTIKNNIVIDSHNNQIPNGGGGGERGYTIHLRNDCDDCLVQGNLIMNTAGDSNFRLLRGCNAINTIGGNNTIRDNIFMYSSAGNTNHDGRHQDNHYINNFFYAIWWQTMNTKGDIDGQHDFLHNTFIITNRSSRGVSESPGGGACSGTTRSSTHIR